MKLEIMILKQQINALKAMRKECVNWTLKEYVKESKEEIIRDMDIYIEYLESALNQDFKKCYHLIKDMERIITKSESCFDAIGPFFQMHKEIVLEEYKKMQN